MKWTLGWKTMAAVGVAAAVGVLKLLGVAVPGAEHIDGGTLLIAAWSFFGLRDALNKNSSTWGEGWKVYVGCAAAIAVAGAMIAGIVVPGFENTDLMTLIGGAVGFIGLRHKVAKNQETL